MFRNYFKVALRNILRHKGFSLINLFGLAVGMAVCILILLWVGDESSFDKFNENIAELYRVVEHQYYTDGSMFPVAVSPNLIGPALKDDYPEVLEYCRLRVSNGVLVKYKNQSFYEKGLCFADPSLLEMFTFPLLEGNKETALPGMESVVISERIAKKYFRNDDPLGKTLTLYNQLDLMVTGVMKDLPANSHLQFDFLAHFDILTKQFGYGVGWGNNNYYTYVQLQTGRAQDAEGRYWQELAETARASGGGGKGGLAGAEFSRMMLQARGFDRKVYKSQASNFYSVLKDVAKTFRYIPGYKHLILLSGGVANFAFSTSLQTQYENLSKELAASDSPVYAVNSAGLSTHLKDRDMRGDRSLSELAKRSGGKYFNNIAK